MPIKIIRPKGITHEAFKFKGGEIQVRLTTNDPPLFPGMIQAE